MQKIIYSLLLSINITGLAHSQELGISVGGKQELILTGSSCDLLLKQQSALCSWKKKVVLNFTPKAADKSCQTVKKGKYKLVVLDCLPEFAKEYQNKPLVHSGPNCWGTAMSFHKLSTKPRFMWPQEMQYWMDSPVCRKLAVGEPRLPGDVINVYGAEKIPENDRVEKDPGTNFWRALYPKRYTSPPPPEVTGSEYTGFQRLLHSVTYVSDELAFGKDSPAFDDRFYFHPMAEVYGRPRSDKECMENQSLTPYIRENQKEPKDFRGTKCSYFSLAYRCESFPDYFGKKNLTGDNLDKWKNIQSLQGLQEKLFPILTSSNKVLEQCEITLLVAMADLTMKNATEEMKTPNLDKNREELLVMEYFSAAGIRKTLELAKLVKPSVQ
ncbi:hypothetical protein SHI21_08225 [Bacteriovorax sp. PP10]|uniref:Uncharacterized protein n=1 Tax=Bacteriovorax antarcticus TaxID=3088717 RepID=A0ABU5VT12_9BACT|nr:hypothetical protein [Bacteriovorax sp. PP10]MEA9356184.1 hypothetical protein [Bacteriovorax sp. PP10]